MKRSEWVGALSAVLVAMACMDGWADTKDNPYLTIVERNPFGLKPPPPPPDPSTNVPPPVAAPLATVELTGITDILSSKRALLEIVPGPGKQMIKPIMAEGERIESVELVAIHMDKNEVTIKNGALVTNLTFKVVKAAPAGPTPPVAGIAGIANPMNPAVPLHQAAPQTYSQLPPGRNNVMVGGAPIAAPAPTTAGGAVNPAGMGTEGFRTIPSRNIRTTAPQAQQPSLEEHYILTELNRGSHNLPLPPTPLNPNPQYPVHRGPGGAPNTPGFPNIPTVPGGGTP